jgi:hypothetical protein
LVTSVVNDVIMPPLIKIMGRVNFSDVFCNLAPSKPAKDGSVIKSLAPLDTTLNWPEVDGRVSFRPHANQWRDTGKTLYPPAQAPTTFCHVSQTNRCGANTQG